MKKKGNFTFHPSHTYANWVCSQFVYVTFLGVARLYPGTVKVWDEGIENNLQRKLMNAPCLQSKDVNWIEVRPNFHRRNLSFYLGLHNCRPFCCTFFQYNLQRASPSNALPWLYRIVHSNSYWVNTEKGTEFWTNISSSCRDMSLGLYNVHYI